MFYFQYQPPRQHYLMVTGWVGNGAGNGNQMGAQVVKVWFLVNYPNG